MASIRHRKKIRIFIDSSVLFAAALSGKGFARDLVLAGLAGDLQLFVSDLVLEETKRNLAKKTPRALPFFELLESVFAKNVVHPTTSQVMKAAHVVPLKDAPIVAGAVQAGARYLVTYDEKHLWPQKDEIWHSFQIKLATPQEVMTTTAKEF